MIRIAFFFAATLITANPAQASIVGKGFDPSKGIALPHGLVIPR